MTKQLKLTWSTFEQCPGLTGKIYESATLFHDNGKLKYTYISGSKSTIITPK